MDFTHFQSSTEFNAIKSYFHTFSYYKSLIRISYIFLVRQCNCSCRCPRGPYLSVLCEFSCSTPFSVTYLFSSCVKCCCWLGFVFTERRFRTEVSQFLFGVIFCGGHLKPSFIICVAQNNMGMFQCLKNFFSYFWPLKKLPLACIHVAHT